MKFNYKWGNILSNFYAAKLKAGDVFCVNTHAKLLNEVFETNYKTWRKSTWRYSKNAFAWIIHIDGKPRDNFINNWLNKDVILQQYIGTDDIWNGNHLQLDAPNDYRLVFEIIDASTRKYIFQGVYLMDRNNSKPKAMIFKKVSNVFPIN